MVVDTGVVYLFTATLKNKETQAIFHKRNGGT